jgi:hypothetical protein
MSLLFGWKFGNDDLVCNFSCQGNLDEVSFLSYDFPIGSFFGFVYILIPLLLGVDCCFILALYWTTLVGIA